MAKLDDSIACHMRAQTIENKDWGVLTREDGVFFHPRGILRAVTQHEADEDALVRLVNTIVRQYDQWLTHSFADDIQQTQQALCCAAAEHSDDMHAIFADPLRAWLSICLRGRLTQTDTTDTDKPSACKLFPREKIMMQRREEVFAAFAMEERIISSPDPQDTTNAQILDLYAQWAETDKTLRKNRGTHLWEFLTQYCAFRTTLFGSAQRDGQVKTWINKIGTYLKDKYNG